MNTKTLNIPLLERVRDHILANPHSLSMAHWSCGTVACIAGWACLLSDELIIEDRVGEKCVPDRANELLGLNRAQENRLFYTGNWPAPFHLEYTELAYTAARFDSAQEIAEVVARRITAFIESNGQF